MLFRSENIQNAVERSKNQILGFQAAVENLQHRIPSDVDGWEGVVNGLMAKSPEWSMRLQKIAQAFSDIQLAFDPIATFMNWLKTEASRRLARSVNEVEISRHNLMKAKEHVDDLESQITSLTRGAQQSISLAEKTIAQSKPSFPRHAVRSKGHLPAVLSPEFTSRDFGHRFFPLDSTQFFIPPTTLHGADDSCLSRSKTHSSPSLHSNRRPWHWSPSHLHMRKLSNRAHGWRNFSPNRSTKRVGNSITGSAHSMNTSCASLRENHHRQYA